MPSKYNPDKEIPSLAGKVILITGGTAGLGAGTVKELAKHDPAHIFFTGRKQKSADGLLASLSQSHPNVKVTFLRCDISSLAEVKELAKAFQAQSNRLDLLILNAGIMCTDPALSVDGYESQFATNYLGHTLLVELLLPTLQATAHNPEAGDVRVVNLTSTAHRLTPSNGVDLATLRTPQENIGGMLGQRWTRYGQSKLAQMLYSQKLAKRHPEITSVGIHPGVIMTGMFDVPLSVKLPILLLNIGRMTPVEEGHYQICWAATCDKRKLENGQYYEPIGVVGSKHIRVKDRVKLEEDLHTWTQNELRPFVQ